MYPLEPESVAIALPPSGLQWRQDRGKARQTGPVCRNAGHRPNSGAPHRFPRPLPKTSGRPSQGSFEGFRPQSVLSERSRSEEEIPQCLVPLSAWKIGTVSHSCTGLDDSIQCLVYLPSLSGVERLPTLPPPAGPEDELEYTSVILPKEVWKPKKYRSPFITAACSKPQVACDCRTKVRLYDEEGQIIYQRYEGERTRGIVRKEILELERLMQGLTTEGSKCLVVQLLRDIHETSKMAHATLKQAIIHEAFRGAPCNRSVICCSELRSAVSSGAQPHDCESQQQTQLMEEIVQFYQEHDEIMEEIRKQHQLCLRELAVIEASLNIPDEDRRFPLPFTAPESDGQ